MAKLFFSHNDYDELSDGRSISNKFELVAPQHELVETSTDQSSHSSIKSWCSSNYASDHIVVLSVQADGQEIARILRFDLDGECEGPLSVIEPANGWTACALEAGEKLVTCIDCHGSGLFNRETCPSCDGDRVMKTQKFAEWDRNFKMWRCIECKEHIDHRSSDWEYAEGVCPNCNYSPD